MELDLEEYEASSIVNVSKHVDGPWFWNRYSAHPYIGCRSGCEFCYSRTGKYSRDPRYFDKHIRIKINAPQIMEKELSSLEPEILACGDWQHTVESKYGLSRKMLEIANRLSFPVVVIERSPLVTRDLDLLMKINSNTWAGVVFSISSLDSRLKSAFEPRSPRVEDRLKAMQELSKAGITVGTAMMPVLPFVGDDREHLEDVIKATRNNGGSFVLAGGLTMQGLQARRTLRAAKSLDPRLENRIREMYDWVPGGKPEYSPPSDYSAELGRRVRGLCDDYGLKDRMPRFIAPGPLAVNKWLAERLFLKSYDLELVEGSKHRIWAYRKAAFSVDEFQENLAQLYKSGGQEGLRTVDGVGKSLSKQISDWISNWDQETAQF